jgi:hypothetical protein
MIYVGGVEFPKGSYDYFLRSEFWVGGVKGGDTLVSITEDFAYAAGSYFSTREFYPGGGLIQRTTRDRLELITGCGSIYFSEDAISEHDIVSVSYDTVTNPEYTGINPFDFRRHKPLGLKMTLRSYSWSHEYARDFVIFECCLENIDFGGRSNETIVDAYVGILMHAAAYNWRLSAFPGDRPLGGDFIGRIESVALPGHPDLPDPLSLIWMADDNGDPKGGAYDNYSTTGAMAVRLLKPEPRLGTYAFNWWIEQWSAGVNWGPVRQGSDVQFHGTDLGWPPTDEAKYQLLSNRELDYPQYETGFSHEMDGWLPMPNNAADIADGSGSMTGLLSFGPFDLAPGEEYTFAFAVIGGEDLHQNPYHFAHTFTIADPYAYIDGLDFSDLILNARWAGWLYDTPGVDTDGNGHAGLHYVVGLDTIYYRGDGVPDLTGPPPPSPPFLQVDTRAGEAYLRWNGHRTETTKDPLTQRKDFEGYRVYMSRSGHADDWRFIYQRDLVNYGTHTWLTNLNRWSQRDPPLSVDALREKYDTICQGRYGYPFHPDSFSVGDLNEAFLMVSFDPLHPERIDSTYHYFSPYGANVDVDDKGLAISANAGLPIFGVIRRLYPNSDPDSVARREDGSEYAPYYEYEYAINDLHVAEPVFFTITAFDHGDPASGLEPLESDLDVSAREIWPINSADVVRSERPMPGVYPNPYRLIDAYNASGWENPRGLEPDPERARKITFYNVPDTCTVSIWSLDGDLVRKLSHRAHPSRSDASVVVWDLITRNTQAVKTGLYIWSIESRHGTDVGKLIIIK